MIQAGSTVKATVTRAEPYGVYLRSGDATILVLAPEISWNLAPEPRERLHLGEDVEVLILRYNDESGEYLGSFRRLHPEQDPYRQLSGVDRKQTLRARVVQSIGDEVTVSLENGAWGRVPRRLLPATPRAGDRMDVTIARLDADEGRLWLEPADERLAQVNGPTSPPAASDAPGARKDLP